MSANPPTNTTMAPNPNSATSPLSGCHCPGAPVSGSNAAAIGVGVSFLSRGGCSAGWVCVGVGVLVQAGVPGGTFGDGDGTMGGIAVSGGTVQTGVNVIVGMTVTVAGVVGDCSGVTGVDVSGGIGVSVGSAVSVGGIGVFVGASGVNVNHFAVRVAGGIGVPGLNCSHVGQLCNVAATVKQAIANSIDSKANFLIIIHLFLIFINYINFGNTMWWNRPPYPVSIFLHNAILLNAHNPAFHHMDVVCLIWYRI